MKETFYRFKRGGLQMNNNTSTTNLPQMLCIKTDKGCFISDCLTVNGYDYEYHRTEIDNLLFDGKKAVGAHCKNWYYIDKYPTLIQRKESGETINRRYEIKNESLISDSLPAIIPYEEAKKYFFEQKRWFDKRQY